ncbi:transmembrane protein 255B isoform X2 [Antennarius striatus]|uniref:transmembrane protein 255B isoform X2 n=1 Tax=Antennarius striatus TaxID=241820 RepID=UPI0035B0CCA6
MTVKTQAATGKDKPVMKSRATEMALRVKRALWLVLGMLSLSLLLVILGLYVTTRAENLNVSGYSSGVILTLGSFLGLLGVCLEENRKQLLTAAILFLSFGIVASFLCLVIDGAFIVVNMDMRPLKAERCQYYSSGRSYLYDNIYTSVSCWSPKESCNMTVRSGTCYCCDLYDCANGGYLSNYYEFVGVQSCEEVFRLYIMIWTLSALNLVAFFAGILNTALLGNIRNLRSSSHEIPASWSSTSSPTAPLLMDASEHTVQQLYPSTSMHLSTGEGTAGPQRFPSLPMPHKE